MDNLLELAKRCESATGSDREIDALIWCAINGVKYASHNPAYRPYDRDNPETQVEFTEPPRRTRMVSGNVRFPHAKPVTASLDAAMMLVPDECLHTARTLWDGDKRTGFASVSRYEKADHGDQFRRYWMGEHQSHAATPALALCAAALRARALTNSIDGEAI